MCGADPLDPTDAAAIANGHPPEADGVVCVDFDGTLYPFVGLMDAPRPVVGAVDAMRALRDAGFTIVIWTSRLSEAWLNSSGNRWDEQHRYVTDLLRRDGIPYSYVTAEKVPAVAYIDDKAIIFNNNWPVIVDWLTRPRKRE
jgi:hypothetical protein